MGADPVMGMGSGCAGWCTEAECICCCFLPTFGVISAQRLRSQCSGDDIANVCNEAAHNLLRRMLAGRCAGWAGGWRGRAAAECGSERSVQSCGQVHLCRHAGMHTMRGLCLCRVPAMPQGSVRPTSVGGLLTRPAGR